MLFRSTAPSLPISAHSCPTDRPMASLPACISLSHLFPLPCSNYGPLCSFFVSTSLCCPKYCTYNTKGRGNSCRFSPICLTAYAAQGCRRLLSFVLQTSIAIFLSSLLPPLSSFSSLLFLLSPLSPLSTPDFSIRRVRLSLALVCSCFSCFSCLTHTRSHLIFTSKPHHRHHEALPHPSRRGRSPHTMPRREPDLALLRR